jgi:hypothetical protein
MGGNRLLNKGLNQSLKIEAAKVAAGPLLETGQGGHV